MQSYKTVMKINSAEITEKRSRFIATLAPAQTEQEAINFINITKAKYWDAKHNVYAYVINENNIVRFSDDNEPHGTAGKPVLDVLQGNSLKNTVIVVTRYFGGILLGTGGLVRAYSSAAAAAVNEAQICQMLKCCECEIKCDYAYFDRLKAILDDVATITDTVFGEQITVCFYLPETDVDLLNDKITDNFFGRINLIQKNTKFFPVILK